MDIIKWDDIPTAVVGGVITSSFLIVIGYFFKEGIIRTWQKSITKAKRFMAWLKAIKNILAIEESAAKTGEIPDMAKTIEDIRQSVREIETVDPVTVIPELKRDIKSIKIIIEKEQEEPQGLLCKVCASRCDPEYVELLYEKTYDHDTDGKARMFPSCHVFRCRTYREATWRKGCDTPNPTTQNETRRKNEEYRPF